MLGMHRSHVHKSTLLLDLRVMEAETLFLRSCPSRLRCDTSLEEASLRQLEQVSPFFDQPMPCYGVIVCATIPCCRYYSSLWSSQWSRYGRSMAVCMGRTVSCCTSTTLVSSNRTTIPGQVSINRVSRVKSTSPSLLIESIISYTHTTIHAQPTRIYTDLRQLLLSTSTLLGFATGQLDW